MNDHRSIECNELFSSISKAQSEIKVAIKDSSNPFFKSSYANLQSIIEASRPSLCKYGLSVIQQMITDNGQDYLVTILCHSSGQWISSQMRITPAKTDVQSLGSYITYLRRYSYAALVGVYDGDDDDGNDASDTTKSYTSNIKLATEEQIKTIQSYASEFYKKDQKTNLIYDINKQYKIESLANLKESDAAKLIAQLSK